MKKRGFTLIELLAVIVILAIIALIATPIVMNVIENSKKGAAERSADNYIDAVEVAIASERLKGNILEGEYLIDEDGNLCPEGKTCTDENKVTIEMSGNQPNSGTIVIGNGQVTTESTVTVGEYNVSYDESGSLKAEKIVETEEETDENATPAECFTYVENYDYTINKQNCGTVLGLILEDIIGSGTSEPICSGNKNNGDLINIANVLGYSTDYLVNEGVISNVTKNGTLSITGYTCGGENGTHKDVVMPKKIDGKKITSIAAGAFLPEIAGESSIINSMVIANGVALIEYGAFNQNQLTSVTIPNSVTTIAAGAFLTNQLTSVTIPNSVTNIGFYAFDENPIEEVIIKKHS